MSKSVKFAFALFVVLASLGTSFARHAGSAATRSLPTTIGSSAVRKCFQGNHCVYRKLKLGRSGGEVRQVWRVI
jgi:hypothetical protein